MSTRTVTVGAATGLHARPATVISQAASRATTPVTLGRTGQPGIDASSMLMLMSLGLQAGEEVVVSSQDETALATIADLVATDLDAS